MAEARKFQSVESTLLCGICLDQFKEPKLLPCSHTFCLGCLQRTLNSKEERAKALKPHHEPGRSHKLETDGEAEQEEVEDDDFEVPYSFKVETKKISCPVCKREHVVPSEGLSHLPADLEVVQAIEYELLQKSLTKSKSTQKCASCSKERTVTNHCDECGGICARCSDAHKEFGVFSQHTVVPIEDVTRENFGVKKSAHLCPSHNKPVTMYCNSCSLVICHICMVKQHQSHSLSLLEEVDEKIREKVQQQSEAVQLTLKVFEGYHKYIAGVEGEVVGESYNKKLKAKVNEDFDEKIKRLQDERECLVNYIDIYDSQSKKQVWSEKQAVELVLNKIQAGLRMVEKARRCVNPADRITMNAQGSKILDEVSKATWSHESLPAPLVFQRSSEQTKQFSSSSFRKSGSSNWQSLCEELAPMTEKDVTVGVVDENGSKVTNPKIGQPTIIEVTFKVGFVEEPKFQILYGKSRQVLNSIAAYEISESKSWNIEFVPRCAGTHFVQVWLGGLAVAIKDNVTINGKPSVGSKVQPGPDWVPPDDTTLYFEGVVTSTTTSSVEVDWKQETIARTSPVPLADTEKGETVAKGWVTETVGVDSQVGDILGVKDSESELTPTQPQKLSSTPLSLGQTSLKGDEAILFEEEDMSSFAQKMDASAGIEDYEPRPKFVYRTHRWGGFPAKYEVELIL